MALGHEEVAVGSGKNLARLLNARCVELDLEAGWRRRDQNVLRTVFPVGPLAADLVSYGAGKSCGVILRTVPGFS